jgi:hypothetical protein
MCPPKDAWLGWAFFFIKKSELCELVLALDCRSLLATKLPKDRSPWVDANLIRFPFMPNAQRIRQTAVADAISRFIKKCYGSSEALFLWLVIRS